MATFLYCYEKWQNCATFISMVSLRLTHIWWGVYPRVSFYSYWPMPYDQLGFSHISKQKNIHVCICVLVCRPNLSSLQQLWPILLMEADSNFNWNLTVFFHQTWMNCCWLKYTILVWRWDASLCDIHCRNSINVPMVYTRSATRACDLTKAFKLFNNCILFPTML